MGAGEALQQLDKHFPQGDKLADGGNQVLVLHDGEVVARLERPQSLKLDVSKGRKSVEEGEYNYHIGFDLPQLELQPNLLRNYLFTVRVKDKEGWVHFDPPPGSMAEKKAKEMEGSSFKRWLYPILAGLGKGSWALTVIIFGPVIARFVGQVREWLAQYLPDWQLPSIPWPEINWPDITMPSINLPEINLPSWNLPDWMDPILEAIAVAMEYSKVWVPILIGVALGIAAVRNKRKSDERKQRWAQQHESPDDPGDEERA